jgi:hypothetical protein
MQNAEAKTVAIYKRCPSFLGPFGVYFFGFGVLKVIKNAKEHSAGVLKNAECYAVFKSTEKLIIKFTLKSYTPKTLMVTGHWSVKKVEIFNYFHLSFAK